MITGTDGEYEIDSLQTYGLNIGVRYTGGTKKTLLMVTISIAEDWGQDISRASQKDI